MPRAPLDIMRVITPMMARGEVLPMSTVTDSRPASAARRSTYQDHRSATGQPHCTRGDFSSFGHNLEYFVHGLTHTNAYYLIVGPSVWVPCPEESLRMV
jgi:hypothetical protein